jgi:hypothetical protein
MSGILSLKPIVVKNGKVSARLNPEYCLHGIDFYELPVKYVKSVKKDGTVKYHSAHSGRIVDLRLQFRPSCISHVHEDFDPEKNEVIGREEGSTSSRDLIYMWHFAHRHGFPSDIHSSGRGQYSKVRDIFNHPLSYILLCASEHENYDREDGEWRNPKNHHTA